MFRESVVWGCNPQTQGRTVSKSNREVWSPTANVPRSRTLACLDQAREGALRFGFCLGGNLFGSSPDSQYADEALRNLDMLVMLNTTLNTGHANGLAKETIILPVLARDEEPEPTTQESMFNYVRVSDGGPRRLPGPRSEVQIIAEIAKRTLGNPSPLSIGSSCRKPIRSDIGISEVVPDTNQSLISTRPNKSFKLKDAPSIKPSSRRQTESKHDESSVASSPRCREPTETDDRSKRRAIQYGCLRRL